MVGVVTLVVKLSVLVNVIFVGWHDVRAITMLKRRERTSLAGWLSEFGNCLSGYGYRAQRHLAGGKAFTN